MRTLTIVRHAKAESDSPDVRDADRALTKKGQKDAGRAAKLITRLAPAADLIVSSPARRAAETAELIAGRLENGHPIQWREEIYNAQPLALLTLLQSLPEDAKHVVLVGHNPGMAGLIAGLASGATHQLNVYLPPGAIASLQLEVYWWNQTRWGCGQLQLLMQPKQLRAK